MEKYFEKHGSLEYAFEMIKDELNEAYNALKESEGNIPNAISKTSEDEEFLSLYKRQIKGTFPDELASAGIKLIDIADSYDFDLHNFIEMQIRYTDLKEVKNSGMRKTKNTQPQTNKSNTGPVIHQRQQEQQQPIPVQKAIFRQGML